MRGILNNRDAFGVRPGMDGIHIGGNTGEVHGDDRLGALADAALGISGIQAPGGGIHIAEDRRGATVHHAIGGGGEGKRRHDDLIASADMVEEQ
jgi:hypothetical protein